MVQEKNELSRRRMLQLTGVGALAAGTLLVGAGCTNKEEEQQEVKPAPTTVELVVYNPTSSVAITQLFTPRLDTLDGKTIGFVGDDSWEDDRTFLLIKDFLEKNYSGVTVITQDNFAHGIIEITKTNNGIAEKMKELGVDAAIVGNAG